MTKTTNLTVQCPLCHTPNSITIEPYNGLYYLKEAVYRCGHCAEVIRVDVHQYQIPTSVHARCPNIQKGVI